MTHRTVRHRTGGKRTLAHALAALETEDRPVREAIDRLSAEGERIVRRLLNRTDREDRRFRERLARELDRGDLDALAAILRKKGVTVDAALTAARRRVRGRHGR